MHMPAILDIFFRPPEVQPLAIWGGKKGEFRDWTIVESAWSKFVSESFESQARSQSPGAFWSAPRNGVLE